MGYEMLYPCMHRLVLAIVVSFLIPCHEKLSVNLENKSSYYLPTLFHGSVARPLKGVLPS